VSPAQLDLQADAPHAYAPQLTVAGDGVTHVPAPSHAFWFV
jgi:hypothetical protein